MVRDFLVGLDPRVSSLQQENSEMVFRDKKAVECLMCDEVNELVFSGGLSQEIKVSRSPSLFDRF